VFHVIFGGISPVWLSDEDVATMANWRGYALYFILPRLLQRFVFNSFSKKVKQLRIDQVMQIASMQIAVVVKSSGGMNRGAGQFPIIVKQLRIDQVMQIASMQIALVAKSFGGMNRGAGQVPKIVKQLRSTRGCKSPLR
jgi:hypothetical protein